MAISSVRITSFRSIEDTGRLELGPVTLLTGRNNSGKSAFLRALYLLASGSAGDSDLRIGAPWPIRVYVYFDDFPPPYYVSHLPDPEPADHFLRGDFHLGMPNISVYYNQESAAASHGLFPQVRPNHYVVPILSRRKAEKYQDAIRRDLAEMVQASDSNLTSIIASLTSGDHPEGHRYRDLLARVYP